MKGLNYFINLILFVLLISNIELKYKGFLVIVFLLWGLNCYFDYREYKKGVSEWRR